MSAGRFQRGCAPAELVGDDQPGAVQPVAQAGDAGGVATLCERRPEREAGEGRLDVGQQLVDRVPMLGLLGPELAHQPLKRVTQMPLAHVQLGVGEASTHGVREAVVVVAHDPRWRPVQRAEERLPVSLGLGRERLQAPQLRAPRLVPHRGEDPERDSVAAGLGSRTRNGNSSSSSDPPAGHARGR